MKRHCPYAALLLALILGACSKTPKDVLGKEEMAQLLADIHMGEALVDADYRDFRTDSSRQLLRQSIYASHGVNDAKWDSSMIWYGNHIEDYVEVYNRTIELLEARQKTVGKSSTRQLAMWGDSVDVWPGASNYAVNERMPRRILSFELLPDSNWQKDDIYILRYHTIGEYAQPASRILVDYANGATTYANHYAHSNSWYRTRIGLDSLQKAVRVYGYIQLPVEAGAQMHVDSISLTRLRRSIAPREYIPSTRLFVPSTQIPRYTPSSTPSGIGSFRSNAINVPQQSPTTLPH